MSIESGATVLTLGTLGLYEGETSLPTISVSRYVEDEWGADNYGLVCDERSLRLGMEAIRLTSPYVVGIDLIGQDDISGTIEYKGEDLRENGLYDAIIKVNPVAEKEDTIQDLNKAFWLGALVAKDGGFKTFENKQRKGMRKWIGGGASIGAFGGLVGGAAFEPTSPSFIGFTIMSGAFVGGLIGEQVTLRKYQSRGSVRDYIAAQKLSRAEELASKHIVFSLEKLNASKE